MYMTKSPIQRFQELIQFATISANGPQGVYEECATWLEQYVTEVGLTYERVTPIKGKPIVLAKWSGSEPSLPCILLNSHYDVVPIMKECWNYDAFEGQILENGDIVGRGTQDMKCVCIQYVEAIRRLKDSGFQPTRTVYLSFVPDEEIGGKDGMGEFIKSELFHQMGPIAIAFDEGLANPENVYTVFYGERTPWWLLVKATGPTGHGSRFISNTAISKLMSVCNKALAFRQSQQETLEGQMDSCGCAHGQMKKKRLGDVTTMNLTMLKSGVTQNDGHTYELNVIPTTAEAGFDVRISPDMAIRDIQDLLDEWCGAETGVSWDFAPWTSPLDAHYLTSLDRQVNPWWGIFLDTCEREKIPIETQIFPAGTDSRFLRQLGIPAFGFSPMKNTEILLHEHNEKLHRDTFVDGIEVYLQLFRAIFATGKLPGE